MTKTLSPKHKDKSYNSMTYAQLKDAFIHSLSLLDNIAANMYITHFRAREIRKFINTHAQLRGVADEQLDRLPTIQETFADFDY